VNEGWGAATEERRVAVGYGESPGSGPRLSGQRRHRWAVL
jgi:hypothetical protein